jgi:beta-glucosidase
MEAVAMAMWRRSRAVRATAVILGVLLSIGALGAPANSATRAGQVTAARPWLDARHPPEQRARLLLAQMTLAEKVDLMTGNQGEAPYAFYNAPIPRLGIPALKMADAGGGVAPRGWTLPGTGGKATAMPSEMALGATWSPDVVRKFAAVVAAEVRETGQNVLLAPDTDIARLPWFGRISESQGEDPILNGDLNSVYAATVQAHNVIATLKHYTANNQETNRNAGQNAIMDERTLREVYALAFEAVIARAGLGAVMCSFNKINGEYSCQNAMTLRTVLKGQLHFTGFVMSDFGALHDTLKGLTAGDDLETGTTTVYDGALLAAVQSGQASLALVNDACLRILTSMFRIGLFGTDYTPTAIPVAAHHAVARAVQAKAITLLKNSRHALPLRGSARKSIAVIGADANILAAESGSAWVDPTVSTPTLEGITARAGARTKVTFTPGNDPVNAASMIENSNLTAVPSSVLTPARGTGPGLTAQYWHAPSFAGPPAVTRVERQVNYDVGFASTFPNWAGAGTQVPLPPVNFFLEQQAVTYDGFLTAPATGDYVLSLTGWGDATLRLDGTTIIDMTGQDGRRVVNSPALHLVAGTRYALHSEYRATRPLTGLQPGTLLLQWRTPHGARSPGIRQAVAAARDAKVAIVYVRDFETEERDRVALKLPQSADQLIGAVSAANPNTVVVLATGGPVTMPWLGSVAAVVQTYFGGQAQGSALADVLWGDVTPQGKLTVTYPTSEQAVPPGLINPWDGAADPNITYSEGVNVGYKGYDRAGIEPLFPFGYGLSYTSFRYGRLAVHTPNRHAARLNKVHVSFRISNIGRRTGTETAQVYLGLPTSTGEPPKRLVGYAQVTLRAGKSANVRVKIDPAAPTHPLSYFDQASHQWRIAPGTYRMYVGTSERDTPLTATFAVSS